MSLGTHLHIVQLPVCRMQTQTKAPLISRFGAHGFLGIEEERRRVQQGEGALTFRTGHKRRKVNWKRHGCGRQRNRNGLAAGKSVTNYTSKYKRENCFALDLSLTLSNRLITPEKRMTRRVFRANRTVLGTDTGNDESSGKNVITKQTEGKHHHLYIRFYGEW